MLRRAAAWAPLLLLTACGTRSSRVDPALARLAPADSILLAGAHVDEIRSSALYETLSAVLPGTDELGLEPGSSVREVLFASDGRDAVALARGTFAWKPGTHPAEYRGVPLHEWSGAGVALIGNDTLVSGPAIQVRAVLDARAAGKPGTAGALLVRARRAASAQLWAVSTGKAAATSSAFAGTGNSQNFRLLLLSVQDITLTANLDKGLNARLEGTCRDARTSETLGNTVRGLLGLARLSAPDGHPEWKRLYDSIQVEQDARGVRVTADLPPDLIALLVRNRESNGRLR